MVDFLVGLFGGYLEGEENFVINMGIIGSLFSLGWDDVLSSC